MVSGLGALGIGAAGGATVAIVIKAIDEYSNIFKNVNKSLLGIGAAITGVGIAGAITFSSWSEQAAQAMDVQDNFNKVVGKEGVKVLEDMQKATLGTIDKYKLMGSASTAVVRGIKSEDIPILARYAMQLGDMDPAFKDVTASINDMSSAIATGRTIALKRMGIILDERTVLEDYVKTQISAKNAIDGITLSQEELNKETGKTVAAMSENEKQGIMYNAMLEEIRKKTKQLADPTEDYADKVNKLNARFTEMKVQVGTALMPIFERLASILERVFRWFGEHPTITKFAVAIAAIGTGLALIVGPILMIAAILPAISVGLGMMAGGLTAVSIAGAPLWAIILAIIAAVVILAALAYLVYKNWDEILNALVEAWNWVRDTAINAWDAITTAVTNALNFIIGLWQSFRDFVGGVWEWILEKVHGTIEGIKDRIKSLIEVAQSVWDAIKNIFAKPIQAIVNIVQNVGKAIKGYQTGGYVSETGLAYLHKGEYVMPKKNIEVGKVSTGQNYNFYINSINGLTGRDIAEQLQKELSKKISLG